MRKLFLNAGGITALSLLVFLPFSCKKDDTKSGYTSYTYTMYIPVFKTLTEARADMKSGPARALDSIGKIYLWGKYIFLNEVNRGIHVIDNSNPQTPRNVSFIPVPGNVDIAIKGATLYADSYSDLIAFDISNPLNAVVSKIIDTVFQNRMLYFSIAGNYTFYRGNPDSVRVAVDWITKDTTVEYKDGIIPYPYYASVCGGCEMRSPAAYNSSGGASQGTGGSMARFTIVNNYLYTISNADLNVFDIGNSANPSLSNKMSVGWNIETIYPFGDKLFIGSSNGMYMYDIQSTPAAPVQAGQFQHVNACDPVIADDKYAYVTLSDGSFCTGFTNELQVVDITNLNNAALIKKYPMTHPRGLSKDGSTLFICDGKDGLKVFIAADPDDIRLTNQFKTDAEAYDVIAMNGLAIVVASDGLYEYDYSNRRNIYQVSKLLVEK